MGLKLITAPEMEPVSIQEFKNHLKMDGSNEDSDMLIKLAAARQKLEGGTQTARAFVSSAWDLYLTHWPCWVCGECHCSCRRRGVASWQSNMTRSDHYDRIIMPLGQLQSVTSIKYTDSAGVQTTWPTTEYEVDTATDPGRVVLAYGKHWPSVTLKRSNPIVIRFVAGWTDDTAVPYVLKAAILLEAAHMYRNREAVTTGRMELQSVALVHGVDDLIAPYRIRGATV